MWNGKLFRSNCCSCQLGSGKAPTPHCACVSEMLLPGGDLPQIGAGAVARVESLNREYLNS